MMRKLLLFVFVLGIIGSSMAQKAALKAVPYGKTAHPSTVSIIDNYVQNAMVATQVQTNRPKSTNATLDTTWFGSSRNALTLYIAQQRCLWYDKNLDAILATYRGNQGITGYMLMPYLTGDDLVTNYSLDQGVTWNKKPGIADGTRHRYPSGVIHNPAGNTDINNSYAVMAGPQTDGTAWINTYKVSVKYDGTNQSVQLEPTVTNEILRQGLTATEDGMVHFCGDGYDVTGYTYSTLMIRNGMFNASGTIDWTSVDISLDDLINRKTDNTLITYFGDAHMAWNNSGTVGYALVRGSDIRPSDKPSWVPLIFKSVDQGATWNQLPYFDFSTLTEITDWILPVAGETDIYKPMFTDFGLTVDALDKPHVFAIIRGAASDDVDSLTYIWTRTYGSSTNDADNNFFEVWQDGADNWHAYHIDTCWSDDVTATESWYTSSTGNVGWDHRLQASRSYDGTKIFGTWTDSDYEFWGTQKFNLNPDLFVFGHDINNDFMIGPTNVTYFSDVWGISFFDFVSPISPKISGTPGYNTYQIPVKVTDIKSTGNSADNPVYHIYVKGVNLEFPPYSGINENQNSNAKVSACYPNPSNGTTFFDVTIERNSNVNAVITNVAGQKVSSKDFGLVQKGTRKLGFDNSNLSSGVYFCTITVGDSKFTNKMIVN
jgi:hypothetical protein